MIKQRNIAVCIVLTILTCGIYALYWFYAMTKETTENNKVYTTSAGMALLLTIVTCGLYGLYWYYQMGKGLDDLKTSKGQPASEHSLIYLLLGVFGLGIVSYALMQSELNSVANA